VLISGEPGIGKSRLTAALSEHIETEPHTRLRYFCSPHLHCRIAGVRHLQPFDIGGDMEGRLVLHPEFSHGLLEFCTVPLRERASPAGRELGRSAPSARPEGDTRQMVQIGDLGNPQPPRGIHGSWQNQQSFFCQQRAHHFRQQSKRRALGTWPLNKRRS
jgi:hypothetical protein